MHNYYDQHEIVSNLTTTIMFYGFGDEMLCKTNINAPKEFEIDPTFKKVKAGNNNWVWRKYRSVGQKN